MRIVPIIGPIFFTAVAGGLFFSLQHPEAPDWSYLWAALLWAGLFMVTYIILYRRGQLSDPLLFPLAAMLTLLGLIFLERLNPELAHRQFIWSLVGLGICVTITVGLRDYRFLSQFKYLYMVVGLAFLAVTMIAGTESGGARAWLELGSFSFQPAEGVKVLIVLFLASYLHEYGEVLASPGKLRRLPPVYIGGPLLAFWGLSLIFVVFQRDLGTALIFFSAFLVMVYLATSRWDYVAIGLALFALGSAAATSIFPHVAGRIAIWLDPWAYIDTAGYQVVQALFSLGSGGLVGTGLGLGRPDYIPAVETDFIFAAIGEEMGLAGSLGMLITYILFAARGFRVARQAREPFGTLLASGLTTMLILQSLIIVGGVTKLLPLTGITLPFVSYGGSSLVTNYIILGLLLRVVPREGVEQSRSFYVGNLGRVGIWLLAFFLVLAAQITYWQFFRAEALAAHPRNPRTLLLEEELRRGGIFDRGGEILAISKSGEAGWYRYYPLGEASVPVTGYSHPRYGRAGMEEAANGELLALDSRGRAKNFIYRLAGRPGSGYDIQLTIAASLQELAMDLLAGHRGAIVVLQPVTGEVLALASQPAFDPNDISTNWDKLVADSASPLLNRAVQGLYPPGSTFKIVTAAAALEVDPAYANRQYYCPGYLEIEGRRLNCGRPHGQVDLAGALQVSCNVTFAQIALEIGGEALSAAGERFGFGRPVPMDLPVSASQLPPGAELRDNELAESAIGQGRVLVTPLHLALITASVANNGEMPSPYLLAEVRDASRVVRSNSPRPLGRVMSAGTARVLQEDLQRAVASGTGRAAAISGVAVAGKTGSAENPHGAPHAWFTGFAPADAPQVVVTVIVENGGSGGEVAAPIARRLLEAALTGR